MLVVVLLSAGQSVRMRWKCKRSLPAPDEAGAAQ
jgi:hypothetical protein